MAKEQDPHSDEMIEGLGLDYPPEILARSASRRDLSSRMEFFAKQLQFLVGWAVFSIIAGIAGCAAGPNAVEAVIGSDAWAPLAPFDGLFRLGLLMLGGALVVLSRDARVLAVQSTQDDPTTAQRIAELT